MKIKPMLGEFALDGIEYVDSSESRALVEHLFELTPVECAKLGIVPLPGSMGEALGAMERSDLVLEALGDHIFEWFLRNKRSEWAAYRSQVPQFELTRYLPSW